MPRFADFRTSPALVLPYSQVMTLCRVIVFTLPLVIGASFAGAVLAQPVKTEHVEAELVSEMRAVVAGQSSWVALRLKHAKDWHTYWRNPGDSGLPTKIEWKLPDGVTND